MNPQVRLFGMCIDALRMQEAVRRVLDWSRQRDGTCRYVVTPNVDHAVIFQEHEGLRCAYADAALVLADGAPVVLASRWLGRPIPERVAGSDLVPELFSASQSTGLRVFLLGAMPGVGVRAAKKIQLQWPHIRVVGVCSPEPGFERDSEQNQRILTQIANAAPDLLLVGLGAPKQELWVHAQRAKLAVPVALCIGATIDFLAGEKARAPRWMRRIGLEWLQRVVSEPRRLFKRYLRDAWIFPRLVWKEWRQTAR